MANDIQDTINALDDLLDDERQALVSGDFDKITRLHQRKSELLEQLRVLDLKDQETLSQLNEKITRNQALLSSAIAGIRSVAQRLAAVRHVREALDTYSADGQKKTIKTKPSKSLEKRA